MDAVWIVDDDESIRWVLERALARDGFDVRAFSNVRDCLSALQTGAPKVLVSDIRMPGGSGLDLLHKAKVLRPTMPVIIMTAFSDLDSAVSSFQGGAFEYLPKPFDLPKALELIRRAVTESAREQSAEEAVASSPEMLGQAPAMQEVFRAIGRLSQSHVTVLITGESGSGKELIARALHRHSPRGSQPFVALNTAAIPRDLLESELFGHERGAFTGAQQMRRGRFEQADGGTLFLDEIGDMPAELQTRLLRVLSDGQFYRVGGHQPVKVNVRVIAATHQNLEERVRQGLFREDLFHRLNVIRLRLPSLRERTQDIALLTRHFLARSARELGVETKRLSDEALARLCAFHWPGNVRQLENVCHWLTVMAPAQTVEVKDLPPEIDAPMNRSEAALSPLAGGRGSPGAFEPPSLMGLPSLPSSASPGRTEGPAAWTAEAAQAVQPVQFQPSPASSRILDTVQGPSGAVLVSSESPGAGGRQESHWGSASPVGAGMIRPTGEVRPVPGQAAGHAALDPAFGELPPGVSVQWASLLESEVSRMLLAQARQNDTAAGCDVMDRLTRVFESTVIRTALRHTRGRRMDAAARLGIGRNTITRKIQELKLEDV